MKVKNMKVPLYFGCRYFADPLDLNLLKAHKHSNLIDNVNIDLVRYTMNKIPKWDSLDDSTTCRSMRLFVRDKKITLSLAEQYA